MNIKPFIDRSFEMSGCGCHSELVEEHGESHRPYFDKLNMTAHKKFKIMNIHLLLLLFITLFYATAKAQQASPDTLQKVNIKWNGIWDPNDPLCPCYEAQKQAEKEYKNLLKEEQKEEANNAESQAAGRAKNSSSHGLFYATGKKMKKLFSRKKKKRKILDDCFNFS